MSFFDAMILGIVQGLTEFLPISSSGHLVILENLLNIRTDTGVLFNVLLHFGTLLAICLVFKKDLFRMLVETIHIFQDLTANLKIYISNKMHNAQVTPYRKILHNNYRTMVVMILVSDDTDRYHRISDARTCGYMEFFSSGCRTRTAHHCSFTVCGR